MEVEQERHPGEPHRQRGEREEVGQTVDLDEGIPAAPMGTAQRPARADEERQVLAQVDADPRALVALDAEAPDAHAVDDPGRLVRLAPEREHVDLVAGGDERLGLPPDPRILVVVGVDDHRHRAAP